MSLSNNTDLKDFQQKYFDYWKEEKRFEKLTPDESLKKEDYLGKINELEKNEMLVQDKVFQFFRSICDIIKNNGTTASALNEFGKLDLKDVKDVFNLTQPLSKWLDKHTNFSPKLSELNFVSEFFRFPILFIGADKPIYCQVWPAKGMNEFLFLNDKINQENFKKSFKIATKYNGLSGGYVFVEETEVGLGGPSLGAAVYFFSKCHTAGKKIPQHLFLTGDSEYQKGSTDTGFKIGGLNEKAGAIIKQSKRQKITPVFIFPKANESELSEDSRKKLITYTYSSVEELEELWIDLMDRQEEKDKYAEFSNPETEDFNPEEIKGRAGDIERITEELKKTSCLLVEGPPGMGKSALAKYLNASLTPDTEADPVVIPFFIKRDHPDSCRTEDILKSLIAKMITKEEFRDFVRLPKEEDSWEQHKNTFHNLLEQIEQKAKKKLILILDGIDEAQDWYREYQPDRIRETIENCLPDKPFKNIQIILFSRTDTISRDILPAKIKIELGKLSEEEVNKYFNKLASKENGEELVKRAVELSQGHPLTMELIKKLDPETLDDLSAFSSSSDYLGFLTALINQTNKKTKSIIELNGKFINLNRAVLLLLSILKEPVATGEFIGDALEINRADVKEALENIAPLIAGEDKIEIFHLTIKNHLKELYDKDAEAIQLSLSNYLNNPVSIKDEVIRNYGWKYYFQHRLGFENKSPDSSDLKEWLMSPQAEKFRKNQQKALASDRYTYEDLELSIRKVQEQCPEDVESDTGKLPVLSYLMLQKSYGLFQFAEDLNGIDQLLQSNDFQKIPNYLELQSDRNKTILNWYLLSQLDQEHWNKIQEQEINTGVFLPSGESWETVISYDLMASILKHIPYLLELAEIKAQLFKCQSPGYLAWQLKKAGFAKKNQFFSALQQQCSGKEVEALNSVVPEEEKSSPDEMKHAFLNLLKETESYTSSETPFQDEVDEELAKQTPSPVDLNKHIEKAAADSKHPAKARIWRNQLLKWAQQNDPELKEELLKTDPLLHREQEHGRK